MMKAIVCRKPHDIAMEERPIAKRGADEVLVKICRVGICGTDYHIYGGVQPFLEYPRVIGHELSAIVEEAPPSSKFWRGQLVVVNPYLSCGSCHACVNGKPNCCMQIQVLGVHRDGGMCEWMCLPKDNLIPANGLSADEAASVEFLAIGAHAVHRSGVGPNTSVLVIGAGPIGLGTALFARIMGSHVTIMDRDPARLALACSVTGINSSILADGSAQEMAAKSTQGNGFDAVFDATGSKSSMENSFSYVAHGGCYVLVGLVKDTIAFFDPDFHKREMTLMASRNATIRDFEQVISAIKAGQIPTAKLITHRTSLHETVVDLPRWAREKNGLIKALIEID